MANWWEDFEVAKSESKNDDGDFWSQYKTADAPKQKGPSLDQILRNQTDETKMMRAGIDAGFDYKEVDRAISTELERQAAASEKRTVGNVAGDLVGSLINRGKAAGGLVQGLGDAIAPEPDKPIDNFREQGGLSNIRQVIGKGLSQYGAEIADEGKRVEEQLNVEMPNSTLQGLYSGVKSTVRQAPMMVSPFGTAATLTAMGTEVGAEKYAEARADGYNPTMAAVAGVGHGGIEVATEILPTKLFKDAIAGKVGLKEFITGQWKEIFGEQMATLGQDAIDQAMGLSGKTKGDWEQYWRERPDAAYQTLLATIAQSGITAGGVKVFDMVQNTTGAQLRQLDQDINNAEWNPDQIDSAVRASLNPGNAQMQQVSDPEIILTTMANAPDVDTAVATALELANAPISMPEPIITQAAAVEQPVPTGPMSDSTTDEILQMEQAAGLGSLTVTDRPTGTIEVAGPNARELVTQIAPGESVQQRKDGSVIVGLKHAEAVRQAIDLARNVQTPAQPVTMDPYVQQTAPDVSTTGGFQGVSGVTTSVQQGGQDQSGPASSALQSKADGLSEHFPDAQFTAHEAESLPARPNETPEVTEARRQEAVLAREVLSRAGTNVVFVSSSTGEAKFGGLYLDNDPGTVYVDVTDDASIGVARRVDALHEGLHDMAVRDQKAYAALTRAVQKAGGAKLTKAEFQPIYSPDGSVQLQNEGHATEEQMANLMGSLLGHPADMAELLRRIDADEQGLAARVVDTLRRAIDAVLEHIQSLGGRYNTSKYEGDLKKVKKILMDGYVAHARKQGKSKMQAEVELARAPKQSPVNTLQKENSVSVVVGGKPGEFGWAPSARMAAALADETTKPEKLEGVALPPFVGPAAYQPNLVLVGESVRKVLASKAAREVIKDVTGATITDVAQIHGSWELKSEPSFVLSGEVTYDQANDVSKLLGFAFAQDATVAVQPWFEASDDQIPAILISQNNKMSEKQVKALAEAAKSEGLDYSTTVDGRGAKFLHFGDMDGYLDLKEKAAKIAKAAGLREVTDYFVRSNLNDAETYLKSGVGQVLRGERDRSSGSGPSDLFRRTVDHLVVPYAKAVGAEGYRFSADRFGDRFGLSEAEVEYLRAAIRPKNGKLLSTVPIVSGQEKLETPRTNTRTKIPGVSKFDLAWAIQNRTAKHGLIDPSDRSDEASKIIADALADEVTYALNQEGGKSAVGWYDRALHNAKTKYEEVFPELRTDPDREMLFDAVLGIASQGNDVHSNALFAGRVYFLMTREGKTLGEAVKVLTGTFGKQTVAIEGNMLKLEALLDRNGYDAMRKFFNTRATVGELNKILRTDETLVGETGQALKIKGAAEQTVTGWMVFGPKIGSFINNLHGDYSTLTADLWFSRTWNRVLGFSFGHSPDSESAQYVKLYRAMLDEVRSGEGRDVTQLTEEQIRELASDPRRMLAAAEEIHAKREAEYTKLRNDAVTPLRQAAKNLIENRNDTQEIPRTDSERAFQQDTIEQVQRQVRRKTGINLTVADIQAVLWYHEKNMYRNQFGVGDSKAEAADYADAAARFVDTYRDGELFYVEKPTPRYIKGEKGDYLAKFSPVQTETDEFKKWFGNSKTRDDDGNPMRFYHITSGNFSEFYPGGVDVKEGRHPEGQSGPAIWLSPYNDDQPAFHNVGARGQAFRDGTNVMPVYVKMEKPLLLDDKETLDWARKVFAEGSNDFPQIVLSKWAKEITAGGEYDGIIYDAKSIYGRDKENEYIVFEPTQIKSAIGNNGQFDGSNPDIRYSPAAQEPIFYSQLSRAFEEAPAKVFGPAKQVKAWLASNTAKLGVKKDEIQWSGINEWLDTQTKVSKEDVVSFLAKNGVQVTEVEKGGKSFDEDNVTEDDLPKGWEVLETEGDEESFGWAARKYNYVVWGDGASRGFGDTRDEAANESYSAWPSYFAKDRTKYGDYTLPGGEDYRELLLTLPTDADSRRTKLREFQQTMKDKYGDAMWGKHATAEEKAYAESLADGASLKAPYHSSHWSEKNILAHIRFNEREDADGNRVLFIEEIQSDWGQNGKKKGFNTNPPASKKPEQGERNQMLAEMRQKAKEEVTRRAKGGIDAETIADLVAHQPLSQIAEWAGMSEQWADLINREFEWDQFERHPSIPSAPFVTDTKSWVALAVKRMMRYAADNGYDKIAFVNGEQSAERYDLSKQVDKISVGKHGDNGYQIIARKGGDVAVDRVVADANELESVVGKEIADKVVNQGQRSFTGLDLKVGGEGMNSFYNQIVPSVVRDILKKTGGGLLETVVVPAGNPRDSAWTYETVGEEPSWAEIETVLATTRKAGPDIYINPLNGKRMSSSLNRVTPDGNLRRVKKAMEDGQSFASAFAEHGDNFLAEIFGVELKQVPTKTKMSEQLGFTVPEAAKKALPLFSPVRVAQEFRQFANENPNSFFRLPVADTVTEIKDIAAALAPELTFKDASKWDTRNDSMWRFNMEGEKDGKRFSRDAYIARKNNAVWVNLGGLEEGDMGGRIYQIAGAYAHNNGLVFIGDPDGITEAGKRRRLENMISLSLKYGSTDFLQPHESMLGWNGLRWLPKVDNLPFLLQTSYNVVSKLYPEIKNVQFDFDTGEFKRSGEVLATSDFYRMASEIRRQLGADATGAPGSGTLRQAALFQSLVSREHDQRGLADRPGDRVGRGERVRTSLSRLKYTPAKNHFGQAIQQSWVAPDLTKFDEIVRSLQDKLVDTKRVVHAIKENGIQVDTKFNPYDQEILYHGRAAKRVHAFADGELKPLLNELRLAGISMREFEDGMWAIHAQERNAQIAKINPNMPDGGSGLTNAQARDILRGQTVTLSNGRVIKLDPAKRQAYTRLQRMVRAINEKTLQTLVEYGLETQETVDTWKRTYSDYVPLNRDLEADDNYLGAFGLGQGTGQGFSVRGSSSRRATGSERDVTDILANMAMQRERAIVRGEKNRVAIATYGLALKSPNPDFWLPINPDAGKVAMTKLHQELVSLGLNPVDAAAIALEPKQSYINPQTGLVEHRVNPALRKNENVMAVRVNGQDRFLYFSSDARALEMVRNLKNLDAEQLGGVTQVAASITRWFASVNTQYNPVFGLVNGMRDMQSAVLNLGSTPLAGHKAKVVKYGLSALAGIYQDLRAHRKGGVANSAWAQEFEEFGDEGGQTGYRDMFQTSKARTDALTSAIKELSVGNVKKWAMISEANPIFAWLSDYNTAIENAFRVGAYKAAKENGMSKQEAAILAKNLTVNFNKKGLRATQAGALYAFFNAAVQGTARIGETLLEHNGNPSDFKNLRLTKLGKQIVVGGVLLGVIQALLGAAAGWDDDDPKQFQREKNFILPIPWTDNYVSIPLPLGFHVFPNIGRVVTEFALSGFKDPGKRMVGLLGSILEAFNPVGGGGDVTQTLAPTIGDPIVALYANRDWTGNRIYKEDFNKNNPTPGWTRTKDTATPWAKALSYGVNWISGGFGPYEKGLVSWTPDQIDYVLGQVTGGVGRELGKTAQSIKAPITGEDLPLYKVPVVGRFVGETSGPSSETARFYENLNRIGEHKDPIKRMKEDGQGDMIEAYLAKHPEAAFEDLAQRTSTRMQKLEQQKQKLIKSGASREEVKAIEAAKKETALVFNRMVRSSLE